MTYELVLPNEVLVTREEINRIFAEKRVWAVGYGSLLFSRGWRRRHMRRPPKVNNLKECTITGWKRGPFGMHSGVHFYGAVPSENDSFNAVAVRIHSAYDWEELMATEMIKGMFQNYNYRVVDVTKCITGIKFKKNTVVHMVANEPVNETLWKYEYPAAGYYPYVWRGVQEERSLEFQERFLATGGYNYDDSHQLYEDNIKFRRKEWTV